MLVDMGVDGLKQRGKDPDNDAITYCWHYSQATVTDQNSWHVAAEKYISETYPKWQNVHPDNYYSEQDAEKAITIGEAVLDAYPDIDLIICNDSTALPGQLQAAENKGYNEDTITITGFASPNSVKQYCSNGTIYNWGLWDCGLRAPWAATPPHTSLPATRSRSATRSTSPTWASARFFPTTASPRVPRPRTRTTASSCCPSASSSPRTT